MSVFGRQYPEIVYKATRHRVRVTDVTSMQRSVSFSTFSSMDLSGFVKPVGHRSKRGIYNAHCPDNCIDSCALVWAVVISLLGCKTLRIQLE